MGMCPFSALLVNPPKATSGFFMVYEAYMKRALDLAASALGKTRTNPVVGAVIVKDGEKVSEGLHRSFGSDHAEVDALIRAGSRAAGAEMYVTLEPCVHYGKTPPCVEAIKAAGIRRVIVATIDPNPIVNGAGLQALDEAGIEIVTGVCENEARRLNEAYLKFITTGIPFVTLKIAQTLDGFIADSDKNSRWITSEEARHKVHQLRSTVDAVLIGAETARVDDPILSSHGIGNDPVRLVLTRTGRIPEGLKLRDPNTGGRTIVVSSDGTAEERQGDCWQVDSDLKSVLRRAGIEGIGQILVEGGSDVFSQFIDAGLVDKFIFVIAPKLLGSGVPAYRNREHRKITDVLKLDVSKTEAIGGDLWIEAYPK